MTSPLRVGCLLALPTSLLAQAADASKGPVMAIAQAFVLDAASALPGGATPGTLLFSRSEFSSTPPSGWTPTPGAPDYGTFLSGLPLAVDAFSIGLDFIESTSSGLAVIPAGSWAGITFSVTRSTTGTAGGAVADEVAAAGGAAADVFFYVLPGSALPDFLVDRTMRSQDSTEIDADAPATPANIVAHDIYTSFVFLENPPLIPLVPFYRVYFSVTAASVPSVPAAWWGASPASGATILARDWIGGAWSAPYPAFTPADFGLLPIEDVDALAVDVLRGRVLFSTTRPSATPGAPLRDPVLYHEVGTAGHFTYSTTTGSPPMVQPVSGRLGLSVAGGIDDVDGICALDPGAAAAAPMRRLLGTPQPPLVPSLTLDLGAAVYRRLSPGGNRQEFVAYMAGWPPPGAPAQGLAFVGITLGSPLNPYTSVGSFLRPDPTSPFFSFTGHPERYRLVLPNNPVFLNTPVFFLWAVLGNNGFALSAPIGIQV